MKVQWFNLYYSVYFGIKTNDMIYLVLNVDSVWVRALRTVDYVSKTSGPEVRGYLVCFLLENLEILRIDGNVWSDSF